MTREFVEKPTRSEAESDARTLYKVVTVSPLVDTEAIGRRAPFPLGYESHRSSSKAQTPARPLHGKWAHASFVFSCIVVGRVAHLVCP